MHDRSSGQVDEPAIQFGRFRLNIADASLWQGSQSLPLTPKAFSVLQCLAQRQGRLVTKDELFDTVSGVAVDTAAQVAAHAGMSEVLVSRTVKDLVAGSGLRFEDHGKHALDGVPGDWRPFAVERGVSRIPNS